MKNLQIDFRMQSSNSDKKICNIQRWFHYRMDGWKDTSALRIQMALILSIWDFDSTLFDKGNHAKFQLLQEKQYFKKSNIEWFNNFDPLDWFFTLFILILVKWVLLYSQMINFSFTFSG